MTNTFKIDLFKVASYLLIPFSGFFLINLVPVSPVYFFLISACIIFLLSLGTSTVVYYDRATGLMTLYFLYVLGSQIFLDPEPNVLINVLLNFFYFFLSIILISKLKIEDILKVCKFFIWFSISLLTVEMLYRLTHPVFLLPGAVHDYRDMEGMLFYAYKFSSIMFLDSNFVATYAMVIFFFNLYLVRSRFLKKSITLYVLPILILATLSRSAIISTIAGMVLLPLLLKNKNAFLKLTFISLIFSIAGYLILPYLTSDISFLSKFKILDLAIHHIQNASLREIFFGIGYGNSFDYIGIGAHNLFITHLLESGIFGLLLFLLIHIYIIIKSNQKALYIILPLFISGLSLVGHAIPYYFTCLGIIYCLTTYKTNSSDNGVSFSPASHL